MSTIYDFSADSLAGTPVNLDQYKGQVVLIVNTASKCGFTPQYKGLEAVYEQFKDKGAVVLGFPCNQFGGQEPGQAEEIGAFCERTSASVSRCSPRSTSTAPTRTRCSSSSRRTRRASLAPRRSSGTSPNS